MGSDPVTYQIIPGKFPASSTDEALARFDSTTGKVIQNSVVTVDDSGVMDGITQLNVDNIQIDGDTISNTSPGATLTIQTLVGGPIDLDSNTTEHITIKALCDVLVVADYSIDDEYDEVELNPGASIELRFVKDGWFIMSSDGLKNS